MEQNQQQLTQSLRRGERAVLWVVAVLMILFRLAHMTGPLDEPSWRQAWCAYQARELARESPPEFMHVKINFVGTNDVAVNNFPLYEGLLGMAYKCVGGESLFLARVFTLVLFLAGALCLYKLTQVVCGTRVAAYTAVVYLCLPLGLFYSRAVHYDIVTLLCCNLFLWASLVFLRDRRWSWYLLAVTALSFGFLLKPPFCMYLAVPLVVYVLKDARRWRLMGWIAAAFIVPVLLGWWMDEYRLSLSAGRVSSIITPEPYSRALAKNWFVGSLALRFSIDRWLLFFRQFMWMVMTPFGLFASCWALLSFWGSTEKRGWLFVGGVLGGVAGYLLVVFPMVSSVHDYYLLPFLAPAAMLLGIYLESLPREGALSGCEGRGLWRMILSLLIIVACAWYAVARGGYFVRDWQRISAGKAIEKHTNKDDLVVSTALGRSTGWTDPRILYFADRQGWAVHFPDLNGEKISEYARAGADYLAVLVTPEQEASIETNVLLARYRWAVDVPLTGVAGNRIGRLVLVDITSPGVAGSD